MGTKPQRKTQTQRGRPTSYKKAYAVQAHKLCEAGATNGDLAREFKVSLGTIWAWRNQFPEFLSALKSGKDNADERVVSTLYHRANGYTHEAVKIFPPKVAGDPPLIVPYLEHVPPDVTACIFWLKNRRPQEWRDRSADQNININVTLADLVNLSFKADLPELPAPKVIEGETE
jgi:hypothetical protein